VAESGYGECHYEYSALLLRRTNVNIERTAPAGFTASETFDIGIDTASPVADDYLERAPFAFDGELTRLKFRHLFPL
jgi:hypothetical protein